MRVRYSEYSCDRDVHTEVHHNLASIQQIPACMRFLAINYGDAHKVPMELAQSPSTQHLRELILGNIYNITTMPGLEHLTKLRLLNIHNCGLTKLFPQVTTLINLRVLILTNNLLTQLPRDVANLTNLSMLSMTNNKFEYVPTEIAYLSLNSISFHDCPLTEVPLHYENNYSALPDHGRRRRTRRWFVQYLFLALDCPYPVAYALDLMYWHDALCISFPKYDQFMEHKN
jgi:Leucine-rich repeat (LRR) protein